jgi:aspartate aminotransferase-like enzyme
MKKNPHFVTRDLFTPGPTPVLDEVKAQYQLTSMYHRSKEFEELVSQTLKMISRLCDSPIDDGSVLLSSSGTGGLESLFVNLTDRNDHVLIVQCGKFGERWTKLSDAYECRSTVLSSSVGSAPTPTDLRLCLERLAKANDLPRAFFVQAHETSTGVLLPVQQYIQEIKNIAPDTLIIVDAVSSLGAHKLSMKQDQIDAVVSGSQKGFGVGPGAAFVSLTQKAWLISESNKRSRFYFDLNKERRSQITGRCLWTPAIPIVMGLHAALTKIEQIGFDEFNHHHAIRAKACRAAFRALKLDFFVEEQFQSNVMTVFKIPQGIDCAKLLGCAKDKFGCHISGGQDDLKGKIVRFSHLGPGSIFHLLKGISGLEFALHESGYQFSIGSGTQAAMQVFSES